MLTPSENIETKKETVVLDTVKNETSNAFPINTNLIVPTLINQQPSVEVSSSILNTTENNNSQILNNSNNCNVKPSSTYNLNQFIDPLEHSLASLEQPQINNVQKTQEITTMLIDMQKQQHQQQMQNFINQQIPAPNIAVPHNSNASNFGSDFNGLMNLLGIPSVDPNLQLIKSGSSTSRFPDVWNSNVSTKPTINNIDQQSQQSKQDKIILTPKPIEELLALNPSDKSKLLNPAVTDVRINSVFGQSFKYEQNLKNASSWSQLASVESSNMSNKSKLPSDTFQEFRTKAKEQQQRQKQEQEKMKRHQKEQEMKRQQETLQKQSKSEDSSNGQR